MGFVYGYEKTACTSCERTPPVNGLFEKKEEKWGLSNNAERVLQR